MEPSWERCRTDFAWDGSLRDIYVREASIQDWDKLLRSLPSWPYRCALSIGEQSSPLALDAQDLFRPSSRGQSHLVITVGSAAVHCHFFSTDELEFDLDPRQVDGTESFEALIDFMKRLGSLLRKPVVLTPENAPHLAIIEYRPDDDVFTYVPP